MTYPWPQLCVFARHAAAMDKTKILDLQVKALRRWRLLRSLGLCVVLFWPGPGLTSPATFEITQRGDARVYLSGPSKTGPEWRVLCQGVMQNCIALHESLVFWRGRDGAFYVSLRRETDARLAIRQPNALRDIVDPWTKPLSEAALRAMRQKNAELVTSSADKTLTQIDAPAVYAIAQYLTWMASPAAQDGQDARTWPRRAGEDLSLTPPHPGDHHTAWQRNHETPPAQLVPVTKPQSEFALRAQGGTSYLSLEPPSVDRVTLPPAVK